MSHGSYAEYQRGCRCDACRTATKRYMDEWHAKNPTKRSEYERERKVMHGSRKSHYTPSERRANKLMSRYGLTTEQWDAMFEAQGRKCACCGTAAVDGRTKQWQTDHSHQTEVLRGIVCMRCNRLIAQMGDHASAVASTCSRILAYLSRSGDLLTPEETEEIINALRTRSSCLLASAAETAHPDRPARARHDRDRNK